MSEKTHTDEFLTAATSGLKHDRELQLDVQAELRSHIEEHQREAEANGLTPAAAEEEAVRAMGAVADVATGLEQANRRRMRFRALVRLAAQWLLAPLAVAVAAMTADLGSLQALRVMSNLNGYDIPLIPSGGASEDLGMRRSLTPDQRLVLHGDTTKPTPIAQQKAIWDKWPTNKVYLHNYVTCLLSKEPDDTVVAAEITKLQPLDPDNARFDYILAGRLLKEAVEDKRREVKGPDGKTKTETDTVIKDRAKLDEAMAHFKAGLAKPEFRRYGREMNTERLAIMGEPTSLLQEIAQISFLAGTLLPDASKWRDLERKTLFYGELLASEGRRAEADIFLNAHNRFVLQINRDVFVLIDVLVVGAIANLAAERVPAIYEKLGDTAAAERAREEAAVLAAPVKQFKERVKAFGPPAGQAWETVTRYGSIIANMLLPALGEYPTAEELAPSRHSEYVAAEGLALGILSVVLFVMMLLFVFVALYYRWVRPGRTATLLLLPEASEVARLLAYGVLLPLLGYYLVTRWLPWGPRELGLGYGGEVLLASLLTLLFVMMGITVTLAGRLVRRRCQELQLPVAPPPHRFWKIAAWSLIGILAVPGFLPATTICWIGEWPFMQSLDRLHFFWGLFVALALLTLLIRVVCGIASDVRFGRRCAAYYGSLARTLIPVVALALILVNICSRPYLRMEERRLVKSDTLMCSDLAAGGFTGLESRLVQRLKAEIQEAAKPK